MTRPEEAADRAESPLPVATLDSLASVETLTRLFGAVRGAERAPMSPPGYSGARFERLTVTLRDGSTRSLVLKRVRPREDWTGRLTGDVDGRESQVLSRRELAPIWEVFACPYLAWAREPGWTGLLMEDLAPHLLPDVREPLDSAAEERLLGSLAALHARFWDAAPGSGCGVADGARLVAVLSPEVAAVEAARNPESPVFRRAAEGWAIAQRRLSPGAWRVARDAPAIFMQRSAGVPLTLVHGDSKVANFALLPGGRVAAFDWAITARAPAALEVGYYLAMNASRLAESREAALARYREALARSLGAELAPAIWKRTEQLATLTSVAMVLWSKALALEAGTPGAAEQWAWYEAELEKIAREPA